MNRLKDNETLGSEEKGSLDNAPTAPIDDVSRGDPHAASSNQDYNQWVAQVQEFFKNQQNVQGNAQGGQYFPAHMASHGYANVWGGQPHAVMTPYGTPAQYYPAGMFHHMGMNNAPTAHPYGAAYTAPTASNPPSNHQSTNEGSTTETPTVEVETKEGTSELPHSAAQNPEYWRQRSGNTMMPSGSAPMIGAAGAMMAHNVDYTPVPAQGLVMNDEREVKRQRRKQSNRESARRSRLRKQAECEDLGKKVNALTRENMLMRNDFKDIHNKFQALVDDNKQMREQVISLGGAPPPELNYQASAIDKETLQKLLGPMDYPKMVSENGGHDSESFSGSDEDHHKEEKTEHAKVEDAT